MTKTSFVHYDNIFIGAFPSVWSAAIASANCGLRVMTIECEIEIPRFASAGLVRSIWNKTNGAGPSSKRADKALLRAGVDRIHHRAQFIAKDKFRIWNQTDKSFFASSAAIFIPRH